MRLKRRQFIQATGAASGGLALANVVACDGDKRGELARADAGAEKPKGRAEYPAQCPYCGVGCATMIQVENERIVGMVPDQQS
ncbi:MAG: twin-arginine translocation signal domain-containing protein, partial [Deltaproteobacteria bacterium]|nr:twin-arginine translocation signal domain-containing protein [Deltaproteobacteria bacterium]